MRFLPAILALLAGAAGWHYLFYSQAAGRLRELEGTPRNLNRVRLRRVNGMLMLLLALALAIGSYGFGRERATLGFVVTWLVVMLLLLAIVCLATMDVLMTGRLRRRRPKDDAQDGPR